jgi:hypothetical protein
MAAIPEWVPQESRVVNVFLRGGAMTVAECGRALRMTTQAAWNHINRLCAEGVMIEVGQRQRTRYGKHPKVYDIAGRTNGQGGDGGMERERYQRYPLHTHHCGDCDKDFACDRPCSSTYEAICPECMALEREDS